MNTLTKQERASTRYVGPVGSSPAPAVADSTPAAKPARVTLFSYDELIRRNIELERQVRALAAPFQTSDRQRKTLASCPSIVADHDALRIEQQLGFRVNPRTGQASRYTRVKSVKEIRIALKECRGNASAAGRRLGYSHVTILRYAGQLVIGGQRRTRQITPEMCVEALAEHKTYVKAAAALRINEVTFWRKLKAARASSRAIPQSAIRNPQSPGSAIRNPKSIHA